MAAIIHKIFKRVCRYKNFNSCMHVTISEEQRSSTKNNAALYRSVDETFDEPLFKLILCISHKFSFVFSNLFVFSIAIHRHWRIQGGDTRDAPRFQILSI